MSMHHACITPSSTAFTLQNSLLPQEAFVVDQEIRYRSQTPSAVMWFLKKKILLTYIISLCFSFSWSSAVTQIPQSILAKRDCQLWLGVLCEPERDLRSRRMRHTFCCDTAGFSCQGYHFTLRAHFTVP